jgi:hypothetical protein
MASSQPPRGTSTVTPGGDWSIGVNRSSANALTDAALAQFIGQRLRGYYEALQDEPLPEKLIAIIERADRNKAP